MTMRWQKISSPSSKQSALDVYKRQVLSKRTVSDINRQLAMNHLKQTVFSSYVKDLYEEVYDYLKSVLTEAAIRSKVEPERLIGEHRVEVKVSDILQADRLQSVIEDIVAKVFRKLENLSLIHISWPQPCRPRAQTHVRTRCPARC